MKERRQSEKARLESLLRISQYQAKSTQDLLDYALGEAISLTQSQIGYIYFYNDKTRQFILNTWSRGVMDVCKIIEPQTVYDLDKTGIWGEAVWQARPIIINDYAAPHPLKKGCPEGHAPLKRFMTLPVFSQGAIVAVLGLGNKNGEYSDMDIQQTTLLMNSVWQTAERKRFEEALARSQQMLNLVISTLPVRIFWKDANLIYLGCNKSFAEEAGLSSPEEIVGKSDEDLAWAKDAKRYKIHDLEVLRSGLPQIGYEDSTTSPQGEVIWLRKHKLPLQDVDGKVIGILGTYENITEIKNNQLRISRLAAIMEASDDAIIGADANGIITDWNLGAEKIYGYKQSEILGQSLMVLAPQDKQDEVAQILNRIRQGQCIEHYETRRMRKGGENFHISLTVSPIFDEKHDLAGFSLIGKDVTDRKNSEDERQRYRDFILNIEDGCFEFDLHGKATFCNEAAHRMLGYTREEYMSLRHHQRYATKEKANEVYRVYHGLYKLGLNVEIFETEMLCKDGSEITMEMSVSLSRNDRGDPVGFRGVGRNVTARKKTQTELERYRDFIENISDGCFELDLKGNITFVNEAVEKRLGYTRGGILDVNNRHYTDAEESSRMFEIFSRVYRSGEPATIDEYAIRDHQGKTRYIEMSISLIRDADGKPVGFRGTSRDKTEKKEIQEALKQSETRYRNIFQFNKAPMLLIDPETASIVDANLAACYYYRYSLEELLQMKITDINALSPQDVREEMARAKQEDRSHFYFKHRLANGEIHPVEVFSGPIEIGGKQLLYSIVHDITERRETEQALRRSEERYRSILESIMEGYIEHDLEGNFIFANDAACEMMGYPREELMHLNYLQIVSPKTAIAMKRIAQEIVVTGVPRKLVDYEVVRKDGARRIHQHNLSLIREGSGKPIGLRVMGRDVTELKKIEEDLRHSEERIRILFNNIPVPTFVWKMEEEQFILAEFNGAAFQFIGNDIIDFFGKTADQFFVRMPQIPADIRKCMTLHETVENEFWYSLNDQSEKKYVIVKYAFAAPDSVLMHVNDITGQKRAEENLQYISVHDSLTGLYNRFYADAEINRMATSRSMPVSVIIIDLNGLKKVNDEGGHALGDQYIQNTAAILKQTFRPEDMTARIGGDEFLVLLPSVDEDVCVQAIQRLNENIKNIQREQQTAPEPFGRERDRPCRR